MHLGYCFYVNVFLVLHCVLKGEMMLSIFKNEIIVGKIFSILCLLYTGNVFSSCSVDHYYNHFIGMADFNEKITMSSDWGLPVLLQPNMYESNPGESYLSTVNCTTSGEFSTSYKLSNSFGVWGDFNGNAIAKTNIQGIGIQFKVRRNDASGFYNWYTLPSEFITGKDAILYDSIGNRVVGDSADNIGVSIQYTLVKYGPTPNSFLLRASDMPCLDRYVGQSGNMVKVWSQCFTGEVRSFNTGTCDIANKTIQMQPISREELQSLGASEWMDSRVQLINCSGFNGANGINNYAEIKMTPSIGGGDYSKGIFSIESNSESATGVALQMRDSSTGYLVNLNNNITSLFRLNNNASSVIDIPFEVRYKKIGDVSAGSVNSSMIITINYK
ncbi:type 1 fimbrial protein [Vibrio fluvialis]|nr:type 1 fimbrial protein [Vibrio fluvialis]